MHKESVKKYYLSFFMNTGLILLSFIFFTFIVNSALPLVESFKNDLYFIIGNVVSHAEVLFITIIFVLSSIFLIRGIIKKLMFLFSRETNEHEIYMESVAAWNAKNYDQVNEHMKFIYEISQKENIHNVYTETAKAMLHFQETDFFDGALSKKEVLSIIKTFLNTLDHKELYLNTIHLAYSYLNLIKLEEDIDKKAIYHLICAYLFHRADPYRFKKRIDIEMRIFQAYFDQNKDSISKSIPTDILNIMVNQERLDETEFKYKMIPFLREQTEIAK